MAPQASGFTASSMAESTTTSEQLILGMQLGLIVASAMTVVALLGLGSLVALRQARRGRAWNIAREVAELIKRVVDHRVADDDDDDDEMIRKKIPLPPGSYGWPWIGETLDYLRKGKEGRPWAFIDERVAKYGAETFKTRFLGFPVAVLTGPAGNRAVCSNPHMSWPTSVMAVLGRESLTAQVGPSANRIRAALLAFLRRDALQHYTGFVDATLARFFDADQLHQLAHENISDINMPATCISLKLFPLMKQLIFSITCRLLFGGGASNMDDDDDDRHHLQLLSSFNTMAKGLLHLPINFPGTRYRRALVAADAIRAQLQGWIDKRRKLEVHHHHHHHRHHRDLLSHLVTYTDEHGNGFSDTEIKDNILLLIFAGHDTTTTVATMTCKYLASNPSIMDDVYKENKEIAAGKASADGDQHLNWEDLQRMKLSWRVVQESMRLTPPGTANFRMASHDMIHDGFRIPKSWKIMCSPYSTHRNPKYFPDPDKFDPSRFLHGQGPAPFTFLPFGGGPRMCPGNEFARMQILFILHHLVTRFSWTLDDPDELVIVDPVPFPANGLPIHLKPRHYHTTTFAPI